MGNLRKIVATLFGLILVSSGPAAAETADGYRLSGPVVHGNLAIYFVHGKSRGGPVPLTLQEALANEMVDVRETERVNDLEVENTGGEEVFVQAGDIVKGGKQDRVLSVSLVLPPHSGPVSIPSFCVESGRWAARGDEDARHFSSASSSLPSREARLGMARPVAGANADNSGTRQREIWRNVAQIQGKLASRLGASVAAPRSRTSLQLSLENDRLDHELSEYITALEPRGKEGDDIVGYVFAVNGKLNSADIYPSNGMFRKMWPKLLRASIVESIGERDAPAAPAPAVAVASEFIRGMAHSVDVETAASNVARTRTRETPDILFQESLRAAASTQAWVHRSYLAK